MHPKLHRVAGLVQRYRIDRRLPPQVLELFREAWLLRRRDRLERALAAFRPVLGDPIRGHERVARLGARRLRTAGSLDRPTSEVGHLVAQTVVQALQAGGTDPFVVERRGDGMVIGLEFDQRERAIEALSSSVDGAGWYLRWHDRRRDGLVPLSAARSSSVARRARRWTVIRLYSSGDLAIGAEQGVDISFWALGSSGELELVGTRGHERFDPRCPATVETVDGHRYPGRSAFPVGANLEHLDEPVDVVFTWVDGADPEWVERFRTTAQRCGRELDDVALDPGRYASRDELRSALRSLWMYGGWVRRIFVVTAGQRPSWLIDHDRITLVDHRELLPADALPTFNSHAIEAALHRIDGLAEHVVYFNDDMMLTRAVRPELFFTPNGLARVFQSGARVPGVEDGSTLAVDTAARRGRSLLESRFGRVVTHKPLHAPYPLRRSVMHEVEREFPDVVKATQRSRFRSPTDLSTAASFAQHFALATGRAVQGHIASEYVHVESDRLGWHLDRIRLSGRFDCCCINETRSGHGRPDRETAIEQFFERMYPIAAPWEAP